MKFRAAIAASAAALILTSLPWTTSLWALRPAAPSSHGARSYLGIDIDDVPGNQIAALHLHDKHGALITRVDHDGPAGHAGLCVHDVVLRLNGALVDNEDGLRRMLRETPAGGNVTLEISRDGEHLTVSATLADRADVERRAWAQRFIVQEPSDYSEDATLAPAPPPASHGFLGGHLLAQPYTGLALDTMGLQLAQFFGANDGKGLLVHQVDINSPAAQSGIRAGDVLLRVNGATVASHADWARALHDCRGMPATIILLRDHHPLTVSLTTDGHHRGSLHPSSFPLAALFTEPASATL